MSKVFDALDAIHSDSCPTKVQVIAASEHAMTGEQIFTFQVEYQRFFHSELMTHRVFSRNASSSRAIPVAKMIQRVRETPAMPAFWGKNKAGMQAAESHNELVTIPRHLWSAYADFIKADNVHSWHKVNIPPEQAWRFSAHLAADMSEAFGNAGYHKQISNRLTETFQTISVVITATSSELDGYYALRAHHMAQPEFQVLAFMMMEAQEGASANAQQIYAGEWHMPYVTWFRDSKGKQAFYSPNGERMTLEQALKYSAAQCARTSYNKHDGTSATIEENEKLHDDLVGSAPIHASPVEHQATPDKISFWNFMKSLIDGDYSYKNKHLHGNFTGFIQYRKLVERGISPSEFFA